MDDKIARYQEIERRGLLDRLPQQKQALWNEYKSRHPELSGGTEITQEERQKAMNKAHEINKQLGVVNEDGSIKGSWVNSDWIRKPVSAMSGVLKSDLNPVGIMAKGLNYSFGNGKYELPSSLKGFEAKDRLEKGIERGASQANDFATFTGLGKGVLGSTKLGSRKLATAILGGNIGESALSGLGGGLLSGAVDSKNKFIDTTLNILGGAGAVAVKDGLKGGINYVKNIRNAEKTDPKQEFVKAFTSRDKVTDMKRGVQSGDRELRERARDFVDKMEARKDGAFDEGFESLIKMPRTAKADADYSQFMSENGKKLLDKSEVSKFYKENPVAKDLIKKARKTDPTTFKDIPEGSLAEADKLKGILRLAGGTGSGEKSYMQKAFKNAENRLKTLMDNTSGGFREVNRQYASAHTAQDLIERRMLSNAKRVAEIEPQSFWTGLSMPLSTAGLVTGAINPVYSMAAGGALVGKQTLRALRRQAGRAAASGKESLLGVAGKTFNKAIKSDAKTGELLYLSNILKSLKGE